MDSKYNLTISDIDTNVSRFLTYIYGTAIRSQNPVVNFIVAGPGAGKTGVEMSIRNELNDSGEKTSSISSDKIAEFHPNYEELKEQDPLTCYTLTRKFVRPAAPKIYGELIKNKVNITSEQTFDKGQDDFDFVETFKKGGYKVNINIIATDILISRLSCYEREALMLQVGETPRAISDVLQEKMYNSFISEIKELQKLGMIDDLRVYTRGKSINKPNLVYGKDCTSYQSFEEAIHAERQKQRDEIISNPISYLKKLNETRNSIKENGVNEFLTKNAVEGLNKLEKELYILLSQQQNPNNEGRE